MNDTLTREQVLAIMNRPILNGTELRDAYNELLAHDAAHRARIAELEVADVVPRSRYDACNQDWLDAINDRDKIRDAAIKECDRLTTQLATAQTMVQTQREILLSLVTVVGHMKVPQTIADAALQLLIVGPILKRAQDFLAKVAQP